MKSIINMYIEYSNNKRQKQYEISDDNNRYLIELERFMLGGKTKNAYKSECIRIMGYERKR